MERPLITGVAIRFQGKVWSLPAPNRHHDLIAHIIQETGVSSVNARGEDQGFIDASGRYLNRKQALVSAQINDQIIPGKAVLLGELYSENVW